MIVVVCFICVSVNNFVMFVFISLFQFWCYCLAFIIFVFVTQSFAAFVSFDSMFFVVYFVLRVFGLWLFLSLS